MIEIIKQNTSAWHELRNKGIGASEAPIIMGLSKYKNRHELFLQKTGQVISGEKENNFIQEKGHRLEPIARSKFEFMSGKSYPDALAVHASYPFIRASFDGLSSEGDHIEIKFVGAKQFKEVNDIASFIKVYPAYYCQMQHQSFITGKDGTLVMINNDMNIKSILIPIDLPYIEKMIPEIIKFWDEVQAYNPETKTENPNALPTEKLELLKEYKKLNEMIDYLSKKQEEIKTSILDNLEQKNYESEFGKISFTTRIGSVDYSKIPELKNVNLDDYRKKPTAYWSIK